MTRFGASPMTTKSDLLNSVDPNLKVATNLMKDVRTAQGILAKVKIVPSKEPSC
jgi:hypothetical protein